VEIIDLGFSLELVFFISGLKAVNKDDSSRSRQQFNTSDAVSFVTVFTVYNSTLTSESSSLVTVGDISYSKQERSLAILNTFLDFIQVFELGPTLFSYKLRANL